MFSKQTKLKQACDNAKIKKEQLYFQYQIFAISDRTSYLTDHNICFSSVGRVILFFNKNIKWLFNKIEVLI